MPRGFCRYDEAAFQGRLWTPKQLQSAGPITSDGQMLVWYDAADLGTIDVDGSNNVSDWRDKSGNARDLTQATAGARPGYSTPQASLRPSVNFVLANSTHLHFANSIGITAAVLSGTGFTAGVAMMPTAVSAATRTIAAESNSGTAPPFMIISNGGTTSSCLGADFRNDANTRTQLDLTTTNQFVANTPFIGTWSIITANEKAYGNDDVNTLAAKTNALSGATTINAFALGARRQAGTSTNFLDGNIHELIIVRGIRDDIRNLLGGYLAWKWNYENLLPGQHPYKNRPPEIGA